MRISEEELLARLAALPKEIPPARDLRPGMWQAIDNPVKRSSVRLIALSRPRLAAAAIVLIAASSAITLLLVKTRNPYSPQARPAAVGTLVSNNLNALERQYSDEMRDLETVLHRARGTLSPTTVRIVEDNLKVIDNAIREAKTALASDPNSAMLLELLRSAYERKLELLRQAAKSGNAT